MGECISRNYGTEWDQGVQKDLSRRLTMVHTNLELLPFFSFAVPYEMRVPHIGCDWSSRVADRRKGSADAARLTSNPTRSASRDPLERGRTP
jgi:hypothetical protein